MAKHRQTLLSQQGGVEPPTQGPVLGGALARSGPVKTILRAQDTVIVGGRRVVVAQSLDQDEWSHPEGGVVAGSQTHHGDTEERPVFRAQFHLSPGCMLRLSLLALPSGQTQSAAAYVIPG